MKRPTFTRDAHGVPHVKGGNEEELYFLQGFAHGTDRGLQILMMRIIGQGRISEILDSSDESLKVDVFFRRANWAAGATAILGQIDEREDRLLSAYSDGLNAAFSRRVPWELKRICRHRPEPWVPEDTILLIWMTSYITLAASQGEMERLLIEMVQAGISEEKLNELFPGILGGLDIDLIQKVRLGERLVPAELWGSAMPRLMASNNWVISGSKTASGKPIVANDVHLEGNRLPAVWCEMCLEWGDRYLAGGTIPGIPGVLSGRNNDVAWGVTYAFVDSEDSWIEHCREGKYFREGEHDSKWIECRKRTESIRRKKRDTFEAIFYGTELGVIDGDPNVEGHYLASRLAPAESGAGALRACFHFMGATSAENLAEVLGGLESAWNWVYADRDGEIGYQMSGLAPRRRKGISGFVPLPGWKKENGWSGFHPADEMPRAKNPPEGFFVTANENLNAHGIADPINMAMGPYRADRIRQLLAERDDFEIDDIFEMHADVYSLQAGRFMKILLPLLPSSPEAEILKNWDLKYDPDSVGAFVFERFYEQLYLEVFGAGGCGEKAVRQLRDETGTFIDFYDNFDRILLSESSAWFGERSRDAIFQSAVDVALKEPRQPWGETRKFTMANMFFGGRLPRLFGFDKGPFTIKGGRATIHQGQLYSSAGRTTSFMPSFRAVSDLAGDGILTNLAGGPSDRRFSKWYSSDVANWLNGKYKWIGREDETSAS